MLRWRQTETKRLFKLPGAIPIGIASCAISVWLAKEVKRNEFLLAAAVIGAGFSAMAVYRLVRRSRV